MTIDRYGVTLRLVQGDLTDQSVDAIVNAANKTLQQHPDAFDEIRFVLFSASDFETYQHALNALVETL